jgi:hypothetical protein
MSSRPLPYWWAYPAHCSRGHPWGPGRVIVSWTPCDCDPAIADPSAGQGHLTVRCRAQGCPSLWRRPPHDPATVRTSGP